MANTTKVAVSRGAMRLLEGDDLKKSRRSMALRVTLIIILIIVILLLLRCCQPTPQQVSAPHVTGERLATLHLGDAVVTGFSGTFRIDDEPSNPIDIDSVLPPGVSPTDRRFIDLNGPAARVFDNSTPGYVWDGRLWTTPTRRNITAGEVGQVFGVAIDDLLYPNIYLSATSAYGLNLLTPASADDEFPTRVTTGQRGANWMPGQFGPSGGPGSIWKVDGQTGRISLFANIELDGIGTGPASLGNLAYDLVHRQLFVSDLSTGMIHRLGLNGEDLEQYDHGVRGRRAANLPTIPQSTVPHPSTTDPGFDTVDPATWGLTEAGRRVFGLAYHRGRLYYAVAEPSQIWSINIRTDEDNLRVHGRFGNDPRWELDLPEGSLPVSDIAFLDDGRMIVAQRGGPIGSYDYSDFVTDEPARIFRYTRENPDVALTPSRWIAEPEEYAVGYRADHRNAAGGIALGYGYDALGRIDFDRCEAALWTTGDNLRGYEFVDREFIADGPLIAHGLQASPAGPVREFNTPPLVSYFVNYDDQLEEEAFRGHVGSVRIYRFSCGRYCAAPGAAFIPPGALVPPVGAVPPAGVPPGGTPPAGSPPVTTPSGWTPPDWLPPIIFLPPIIAGILDDDNDDPTSPVNGTCMNISGQFACDGATGNWVFSAAVQDTTSIGIDTLRVYSQTPGVSVANGPNISTAIPPALLSLSGTSAGQTVALDVCGYNSADEATGEPYDCCRQTIVLDMPQGVCSIQ